MHRRRAGPSVLFAKQRWLSAGQLWQSRSRFETIDGLWDINSTSFGRVDDFVAPSEDYGKEIRNWQGVERPIGVEAFSS